MGVDRSLPMLRWCWRNSSVTTAQIVWLPRSSGPVLQQPFRFGADIVLHSVTKFLNGHADVVGGVLLGMAMMVTGLRPWAPVVAAGLFLFNFWAPVMNCFQHVCKIGIGHVELPTRHGGREAVHGEQAGDRAHAGRLGAVRGGRGGHA